MASRASHGLSLAKSCAQAAADLKAEHIQIFDLRSKSSLTDFTVLCSGNSMPHLKALLRDLENLVFESADTRPLRLEGQSNSRWVILDYIDVMVHIMLEETRELYELEELWSKEAEIPWKDANLDSSSE